jgi:tetratricopeptide (TPR) repeat protein
LHRPEHIEVCKNRLAELFDKQLFTQPDISHLGECPICCLPLPIDLTKSTFMACCCKIICNGCNFANKKREIEQGLEHRCAFCREPNAKSQEEVDKRIMERIKKHDPAAMTQMGKKHVEEGDYGKVLQYWTKAAELGDANAHAGLGGLYYKGLGGVEKDEKKALPPLEQAAIGGHPQARYLLAAHEIENGRFERAAKHFIIAANLGHDHSLKSVKRLFMQGVVSKEEYAAALRAHQAAVDATKSAERDKAEEARYIWG